MKQGIAATPFTSGIEERRMEQFMEEARMVAAQCWCDDENKSTVMDPALAESVARRIAAWMDTAAMFSRNADFYRDLVDKCAEHLGREAYTADDGTVMDGPVRLKVPELVEKLVSHARARTA